MNQNDIGGLLITGPIFILVLVLALVLLSGRGAFLIAGYNTMKKEEQQKYRKKALCRFVGGLMLFVDLFLAGVTALSIFQIDYLVTPLILIFIVVIIGAVIYMNTGGRFKKDN